MVGSWAPRSSIRDSEEGYDETPITLHPYIYAGANPVDNLDPSGNDFDAALSGTINTITTIQFQLTLGDLTPIVTATQPNRPSSAALWNVYPSYDFYYAAGVWKLVGGSLGTWAARAGNGDYENSCATRVSYALNHSGAEIPGSAQSIDPGGFRQNLEKLAYKGNPDDNKWYIIRAGTIDKYLRSIWGQPGYVVKTAKGYDDTISHLDAQHQQVAVKINA